MPATRPERPLPRISTAIPRVGDGDTQRALDRVSSTFAQILSSLELFDSDRSGRVPASPGGTTTFLRADGTWSIPPGGGSGVTDGDYGDVIVSGTGTVWTVDALPESRISGLVADLAAKVPTSRTLTTTAPLTIGGGASADLSADRTLAVSAFGTAATGIVTASGGATHLLLGDNTWITQTALALALGVSPFYFGNGSDGAATFDGATAVTGCTLAAGVYTMTRHCYWTTATCTAAVILKNSGYIPHALILVPPAVGTFIVDASGGDAAGASGGLAPWAVGGPLPNGLSGGNADPLGGGANPGLVSTGTIRGFTPGSVLGGALGANIGANGAKGQGGGGGGGAAAAGGDGGVVTVASSTLGDWMLEDTAQSGFYSGAAGGGARAAYTCGSSGGSGGGGGAAGRRGGGGAGSGGWLTAKFRSITGTAANIKLRSNGGTGAPGLTSGGLDGGGGAGGNGGIVVAVLGPGVTSPTIETLAGAGALAGGPTAGRGGNGGNGDSLVLQ